MITRPLFGAPGVTETVQYDIINGLKLHRWDKDGDEISLHSTFYEGLMDDYEGWLEKQRAVVRKRFNDANYDS
jgi:hypothetical protein